MGEIYKQRRGRTDLRECEEEIAEIFEHDTSGVSRYFLKELLKFMDKRKFLSYLQVHALGKIYDRCVPVPESRWTRASPKNSGFAHNGRRTARTTTVR